MIRIILIDSGERRKYTVSAADLYGQHTAEKKKDECPYRVTEETAASIRAFTEERERSPFRLPLDHKGGLWFMTKEAFLTELRTRLSGLPKDELEERITFYREMIDNRMAEGQSEEDSTAGVGPVDVIAKQIMSEVPLGKLVEEKVRRNQPQHGGKTALLILGAPLWIPLLIAALAVFLSVYAVLWAVVLCFWAAEISLAAAAVACLVGAVSCVRTANYPGAGTAVGACLLAAGLTILFFYACVFVSKGMIRMTGKIMVRLKSSFFGKEA